MHQGLTLALLVALAGCRPDKLEYHRVEFPGFSLEAPTTLSYGEDLVTEYRAGQARSIVGSRIVIVGWQPGANATAREMPVLVRAITAVIPKPATLQTDPAQTTDVAGNPATRLDARIETMKLSLVDIACGKRAVMIGVGALGDLDDLRGRVVGSFHCHPVAAQDQAIGTTAVPIGVDDPAVLAGWHRVDDDDTFTISNDEMTVVVTQIPRAERLDAGMLNKVLPAVFGSAGADWTTEQTETRRVGGTARAFQRGRMTAEGETMAGVVTVWSCAGRGDAVMALALAPGGDSAALARPAIGFLTQLRCARPDDPPLPLAPAPPDDPPAPDAPDAPDAR